MPDYSALDGGYSSPLGYDVTSPMSSNYSLGGSSPLTLNDATAYAKGTLPTTDSPNQGYGLGTTIAGDVAMAPMDLVDTVASSIPFVSKWAGIQRGDFNDWALNAVDMPGLRDFYNDNRGGIEAASGLLGIGIIEGLTGGLATSGVLADTLATSGWARKALSLDESYKSALSVVNVADKTLAEQGLTGTKLWTSTMGDSAIGLPTSVGGTISAKAAATPIWKLGAKTAALGAAKGAVHAATTEAIMATTLNQNGFLYDADMGVNIANAALGMGIGGAFGTGAARYAMRKFVTSDSFRRIVSGALDPSGFMNALTRSPAEGLGDATKSPFAAKITKEQSEQQLGYGHGTTSDQATAELMAAREATPTGVDPTTHKALQAQYESAARTTTNQITTKGLPYLDASTGFSTNVANSTDPGFARQINNLTHNDPGSLLGAEFIGAKPDDMTFDGMVSEIQNTMAQQKQRAQEILSNDEWTAKNPKATIQLKAQIKKINWHEKLNYLPVIDGQITTMDHARAFDTWAEPNVRITQDKDLVTHEAYTAAGKPLNVSYDNSGLLTLPGNLTPNTADYNTSLNMFRTLRAASQSMVNDPKAVFKLPENPNWTQIDMAGRLQRLNPNATIMYPGTMTPETAFVESLAQKVDGLRAKIKTNNLATANGVPTNPDAWAKLGVQFNLPRLTAAEQGMLGTDISPTDALIRGFLGQGVTGDAIRSMSYKDIQDAMASQKQIGGVTIKQSTYGDTMMGNSFDFLTDHEGNPTKPLLMMKRTLMQDDYTPDRIAERIAISKVQQNSYIATKAQGVMNRSVSQFLMSSPDSDLASQVTGLTDRSIGSAIPIVGEAAPQTPLGRLFQGVTTQEWRGRDTPQLLAADRLRSQVDRIGTATLKQTFDGAFGSSLVDIENPRNRTSKFLWNQFLSHSLGWDLLPTTTKRTFQDGSEAIGYQLDPESATNIKLFKQLYGRDFDIKNGEVLRTPQDQELLVDPMAHSMQMNLNKVTDALLQEKNGLLESQGLPTLERKNFYVPTGQVKGRYIGYTLDATNNVIPFGTINAATQQDYDRQLARMAADPTAPMNRDGNKFHSEGEIQRFNSTLDMAKMDMQNPGRTWTAGGKTQTGSLATRDINMNAANDMLAVVRNQWIQHPRDIIQAMFSDTVKAAESRSAISSTNVAGKTGLSRITGDDSGKNVYDYYLESLLGRSPLDSDKSWVGKLNDLLKAGGDPLVRTADVARSRAWGAAQTMTARVNPFNKTPAEQALFEDIAAKLGTSSPFQDAADLMEQRNMGKRPPTLASLGAASSRFEATWLLRMMEPVQAFMNLSGILNAAPAVIRHLQQGPAESLEDYANRVGHSANIFTTPTGKTFSTLDMGKLTWQAFKQSWSGAADPEYARLIPKGMVSQEVRDFENAFRSTETNDDGVLKKFWNGDPTATNPFLKGGIEKSLSWMTDKSEDFSRAWAQLIGNNVGRQLGITDLTALDNFGHDIANKMIANYNPLNRAPIFQGAAGTPIGLFQGFIWAYYQRMFRYMETGDMRALATQFATQGASFGLKTIPGFNEVNNWWFQNADGKSDPYDKIVDRFGTGAGDMIMGGVWGNLPKLLGGKAVDFSSRGNTSLGVPVLTMPAAIQTMSKVLGGTGQMIHQFTNANTHLSGQQIAEIASNMIPNRPLAGMIETFGAGGNDTDNLGQLVSRNYDFMDATARVLGVRTQQQQADLEAYYSSKQQMEINANKRQLLNASARAAIRSGNPDDLNHIYSDYIESGGDPRGYKRWVKSNIQAAVDTRSERMLKDSMRNPNNQAIVDRLLNAQVGIPDEANQPDPQQAMAVQDTMENQQPTNSMSDDANLMYNAQP